jgi:hypothetical protein
MATVQVVMFCLPAIGAISLFGAWLATRMPGRASLAGQASTAVITAFFGPRRVGIPRHGRSVRRPLSG